jgi:hypothetical protein
VGKPISRGYTISNALCDPLSKMNPDPLVELSRTAFASHFKSIEELALFLRGTDKFPTHLVPAFAKQFFGYYTDRRFLYLLDFICPPEPHPTSFSQEVRQFTRIFLLWCFMSDNDSGGIGVHGTDLEWPMEAENERKVFSLQDDDEAIMELFIHAVSFIYQHCTCFDNANMPCLCADCVSEMEENSLPSIPDPYCCNCIVAILIEHYEKYHHTKAYFEFWNRGYYPSVLKRH